MENNNLIYDCSRGCVTQTKESETLYDYKHSCCKRSSFDWLEAIPSPEEYKNYFEVRYKNTHKQIVINDSGQNLKVGDIVVVEAANGHNVGIITLGGAVVGRQMARNRINPAQYDFKKIYRKAKPMDTERWQEAIAREHGVMIRSRQIAQEMGLDMKIGDVEMQGDGTKAIFYYIADERVDFRQLIKRFAEEFRIRIEMKQIGARQEAGLIGGIGVCGRALCCSSYMANYHSITTQTARGQDLSLNPQKLTGQCGKLKCCINHEAEVYSDAMSKVPHVHGPLQFQDGVAYLKKTDILKGIMWFSYNSEGMSDLQPLRIEEVKEILRMNAQGNKPASLKKEDIKSPEFVSAVGDGSINRFDNTKSNKKSRNKKRRK